MPGLRGPQVASLSRRSFPRRDLALHAFVASSGAQVRAIQTGPSSPSVFPTVLLIAAAILASIKNGYVEVDQRTKLHQTAVLNLLQAAVAAPFMGVNAVNVSLPNGVASIGLGQANALIQLLRAPKGVEG